MPCPKLLKFSGGGLGSPFFKRGSPRENKQYSRTKLKTLIDLTLIRPVRSHNPHAAEIVIRQLHRVERVAVAHILLNDKPFDPISSAALIMPFQLRLPVPTGAK